MVECFRKFENRSSKIAPGHSLLITKFIDLQLFTLILYDVGGPLWSWHLNIFKLTASAQSIYREVYA